MVYTGITASGSLYQIKQEEIYRALIKFQGGTHSQQSGGVKLSQILLAATWYANITESIPA